MKSGFLLMTAAIAIAVAVQTSSEMRSLPGRAVDDAEASTLRGGCSYITQLNCSTKNCGSNTMWSLEGSSVKCSPSGSQCTSNCSYYLQPNTCSS
jgi:hypothetical protein